MDLPHEKDYASRKDVQEVDDSGDRYSNNIHRVLKYNMPAPKSDHPEEVRKAQIASL